MEDSKTTQNAFAQAEKIVNDDSTVVTINPATKIAVEEHEAATDNFEKVNDDLKNISKEIEKKPEDAVNVKNDYTKKLTLTEDIQDFSLPVDGRSHRQTEEDTEDDYLDYDMFDFIYGLVTDCWPKPKNPLNHRMRKFMYAGSDDYAKTCSYVGVSQVAVKDDSIEVYADNVDAFNDIKEVCDLYKFKYSGPTAKRSSTSRWNFSFCVDIPCSEQGYPEMVEFYFESIGKTLEEVMPMDWVNQYRKRVAASKQELEASLNDKKVEKIVADAIKVAANDNLPIEDHLTKLFQKLNNENLVYQKNKIKKEFINAFKDDPEQ